MLVVPHTDEFIQARGDGGVIDGDRAGNEGDEGTHVERKDFDRFIVVADKETELVGGVASDAQSVVHRATTLAIEN